MGLISRVYRFINGTPNDGTEVDSEFQIVFDLLNGNIDNANISPSAAIAASKLASIPPAQVLDHADSEAEYNTATTPGDTGTPSMPSTLEGELERLRYRIGANRGYLTPTFYMDGSGPTIASAAWYEPPIVGPNLLPNPGFEAPLVSGTPPGWSLLNTPTLAIETPADALTGVEKRSLNITTNASDEGITCVVGGIKRNTKYLIGVRYTRTAGTLNLTTSGALATGDYQNLNITDGSGTSLETVQGIVKSEDDSAPSDITVSLFCSLTGAEFNIHDVWMYELADGTPNELPSIPVQTATSSTQADYAGGVNAWAWGTDSALSLSQYIPYRGYRLTYEVSISYTTEAFAISAGDVVTNPGNEFSVFGFRIQLNTGSGASTVAGPYIAASSDQSDQGANGGIATLKYVVDNPTPGLTYSFTTNIGCYSKGAGWADCRVNPLMEAEQAVSTARLIVERL